MSTEVIVDNQATFSQAMAEVRSDSSDTNWALFGHTDNRPNNISLIALGSEGVEEIHCHLDDTQYMYGLARLEETFDMSTTVKFVYIKFQGKNVPFVKRGKYGVVLGSIEKHFDPYHVIVEVDAADELTTELLHSILQENSGTKSKVLEASEAKARPERGFTSGTTTKVDATGSTPTKSAHITGIGKGGSSFGGFSGQAKGSSGVVISQELCDAVADVKNDTSEVNWCAGGYEDGNIKKPIICLGSGNGSVDDIKAFCTDDSVVYGYIRMKDIIDDIPTIKFAYIQWVGDTTRMMTKAKITTHKGVLEELFKPAHVTVYASAATELSQRVLMDKVSSASGSKKSHVK